MNIQELKKQYFMHPDTPDADVLQLVSSIDTQVYHDKITDINYVPKTLAEAKMHPLWVDGHLKVVILLLGILVLLHLLMTIYFFGFYEYNKVSVYITLFFALIFWLYFGGIKRKGLWLKVVLTCFASILCQGLIPLIVSKVLPDLVYPEGYEAFVLSGVWFEFTLMMGWIILWTLGILAFHKKYKINYMFNS